MNQPSALQCCEARIRQLKRNNIHKAEILQDILDTVMLRLIPNADIDDNEFWSAAGSIEQSIQNMRDMGL